MRYHLLFSLSLGRGPARGSAYVRESRLPPSLGLWVVALFAAGVWLAREYAEPIREVLSDRLEVWLGIAQRSGMGGGAWAAWVTWTCSRG